VNVDTFIIQEFVTRRKCLVPGQRAPGRTKHHALNDAERLAKRAEGVAVNLSAIAAGEGSEVYDIAVERKFSDFIGMAFEDHLPRFR
jgi:hypothetical protein